MNMSDRKMGYMKRVARKRGDRKRGHMKSAEWKMDDTKTRCVTVTGMGATVRWGTRKEG